MRANRPVASAKAKPRTAYEKSWPAITQDSSARTVSPWARLRANELLVLTSEGGVAGDAIDERAEDGANADAGASETDGGSASTMHLGGRDEGGSRGLDDDAPGLHGAADHGGGERVTGAIEDQAVAAGRLACSGRDDGARDAGWRWMR